MSTIRQGLRLLELLAAEPKGARLSDLARALGVNKAIPFRLLAELGEMGYVIQNPVDERYRATFKLGALGLEQLEAAGIRRWSQDALRRLADRTQELVRLGVVTDGTLRWLAKAQGSNSNLIVDSASGAEAVPHATASGKAWLSTLPRGEIEQMVATRGLTAQTDRTTTDLGKLVGELERVRSTGYATVNEEMDVGISAIASPIVPPDSSDGRAVGTVSLAGPSARLTQEVLEGFAPALRDTASELGSSWRVYIHFEDLLPSRT